jgi:hypothetical protein
MTALSQEKQEAVRKHLQGLLPPERCTLIKTMVISPHDPDMYNVVSSPTDPCAIMSRPSSLTLSSSSTRANPNGWIRLI